MRKLQCTFTAQEWIRDYTYAALPRGKTTFTVQWPDKKPIPKDCSYESDNLRFRRGTPTWIREWKGPFEIHVINREA